MHREIGRERQIKAERGRDRGRERWGARCRERGRERAGVGKRKREREDSAILLPVVMGIYLCPILD